MRGQKIRQKTCTKYLGVLLDEHLLFKDLVQWLWANKIALNVKKTNIVIFRSPRKQITKKMNFHMSGQKIRQKTCTKYLGVLLDEHLLFKDHINTLK